MSVCLTGGLLLSAYACGGSSGGPGDDGSGGGSGASGGSGGTGGDASGGSSGEAGSNGSGGSTGGSSTNGGTGGSSTNGGTGGSGASGGSGGTMQTIECTDDTDCEDADMVCDPLSERCAQCLFDSDCGDGERCDAKNCVDAVACESSVDCDGVDGTEACDTVNGQCVTCVSSSDCSGAADCIDNECRPYQTCSNSLDCPAQQVCYSGTGRCVQCVSSTDCGDGMQCLSNTCRRGCSSDNDCTALGLLCNFSYGVCARCVADTDCPDAYHCSAVEGRCLLDACEQGSGYCDGNYLYACNSAGSAYEYLGCSSAQTCVDEEEASCQDHLCTPGATECNAAASAVITCAADGLSIAAQTPCPDEEVCYLGECLALDCVPNSTFCQDDTVRYCYSDGLSSYVQDTCLTGEFCQQEASTAACVDLLCEPDAPACNGSIVTTCNSAGDGYVSGGTDCADSDEFCVDGECQECDGSILLLGDVDTTGNATMQAALESAGMAVTVQDGGVTTYNGTPAATGFGAVVASVGLSYSTSMPQAGQDSIVAAHAAGKGYLTNEYAAYQQTIALQSVSLGPLTLLNYGSSGTLSNTITLTSTGHPIWDGVPTSFTPTVSSLGVTYGALINSGVAIATCVGCDLSGSYSGAFVAVREGAGGRLVHLAHSGNASLAYTDANLLKMFVNAAQWAAGCK